jgi:hypothetical protein
MEELNVDAVVDEAVASQETQETTEDTTEETVVTEQPEAEVEENAETEANEEVVADDPFPKKAVNAIHRRDKQNTKLRAQNQELMQRLEALESAQPKQVENSVPSEDDFDTYGEFLRAEMKYQLKEELGQREKSNQEQHTQYQQEQWVSESRDRVSTQLQEEAARIPDLANVWQENGDILDALPPHVEMALYEADNAPLAIYTLAKEGKLEALATLSPARAAMEIGQAQVRADKHVNAHKKVSNAPTPMTSVKGTGSTSKTVDQMNTEQLLKWVD